MDVNVLIALVDPAHIQHDHAHGWFARVGHKAFATCPLTENGLIRIDLSVADAEFLAAELLTSHSRVTDSYLLGLAHTKGGRLATMDQKLATQVVPEGKKALTLIPPG